MKFMLLSQESQAFVEALRDEYGAAHGMEHFLEGLGLEDPDILSEVLGALDAPIGTGIIMGHLLTRPKVDALQKALRDVRAEIVGRPGNGAEEAIVKVIDAALTDDPEYFHGQS